MALGINWDDEDALYNPPKVEKSIVRQTEVDAATGVPPVVLKDTTPSSAVGQASVPPSVATPTATGSPVTPQAAVTPPWVTNAASSGGAALKSLMPIIDPRHYEANGQLDQAATAAHTAADLAAAYTALKTVQGVGSGISRRITNVIGGVDPTIQAQIDQSNKQAARAAAQPQGRMPDPIATSRGRIEPTMAPEPPPPPPAPEMPKPPVTPAEKAALAVAEQTPMQQAQLRLANAKADAAELSLLRKQQAGKVNVPGATPNVPTVAPEVGRTLEQTAALGKTLTPTAPIAPATPVVTPLPIETTPVTAPDTIKALTPEITGQAGAAVKPSVTEIVAELNQRIQPLPAPTKKELAFAEKQLKAGKELPLVESRRSPVEKAIFDEEKKLNAAQRQLATQLGGDKVPETEWRSFQDEVYGKNPPKSGAKGGGVPEWDSVVKTAKENPKKYPAIVSAIENIEKKYPKQSGKANIGMLMSLAGNLLGGIGIAKALKEGDTATAGLGAIDQLLANTAMLAGKKGALGAVGSAAGRLAPFMIGMTPTAVSSGTLNSPEAQALFRNARPTGAVPPPR